MAILTRNNIVTNGLVLYLDAANKISYPGTGTTWNDLSGNNNSGSLINGPTFSTDGGGSIVFDGSNDYVDTNVDLGWGVNNNITLEIYIKSVTTSSAAFLGTPEFEWQLKQGPSLGESRSNTLGYVYWDTGGSHTNGPIISINDYFDNNWKHLVLTWDRITSITSIYGNGSLITAQISNNPAVNRSLNQTIRIGGNIYRWGVSDRYWRGLISVVKAYNRALSASEIQQNYNATKTRFGLT